MKKIRLAIIGFGGMAGHHFNAMVKSGLFDIVGAYDINEDSRINIGKIGIKSYDSYEKLVSEPNLDACLIATPNDVHEDYLIKLANDKINVICEKPVTLSSDSLLRMTNAARDNNIVFMVHQNRRWDTDYLIIKNIYQSKALGEMYKVDSNVTGSHGMPGDWRKIKAKGGGMLLDWGVHLIDQMLMMNESKLIAVTARASFVYGFDCDDGVYVTLDFANGMQANINIDTNKFIATPRWYAYGLEGTAVIDDWSCGGRIVKVKTFIDKQNKGIKAGNGFTKTMADRSDSSTIKSKLPKVDVNDFAFYKCFYDSVVNGAEPIISDESVMRCMLAMEACFKSIEEKRTIIVEI